MASFSSNGPVSSSAKLKLIELTDERLGLSSDLGLHRVVVVCKLDQLTEIARLLAQ